MGLRAEGCQSGMRLGLGLTLQYTVCEFSHGATAGREEVEQRQEGRRGERDRQGGERMGGQEGKRRGRKEGGEGRERTRQAGRKGGGEWIGRSRAKANKVVECEGERERERKRVGSSLQVITIALLHTILFEYIIHTLRPESEREEERERG